MPATRTEVQRSVYGKVTCRFRKTTGFLKASPRGAPVFFALLLVTGAEVGLPQKRQQAHGEYDLKAAVLFNFHAFVEWPSEAFADDMRQSSLGYWVDGPIWSGPDRITRAKPSRTVKLVVKRSRRIQELKTCQVFSSVNRKKAASANFNQLG